jgi:hypothetical protein
VRTFVLIALGAAILWLSLDAIEAIKLTNAFNCDTIDSHFQLCAQLHAGDLQRIGECAGQCRMPQVQLLQLVGIAASIAVPLAIARFWR